MKKAISRMGVMVALTLAAIAFAQSPLAGTWKFNAEKSKLTGDTFHFAAAENGSVRFSGSGQSYAFKLDGSDRATIMGYTSAWTRVDDNTWREVVKKGTTTLATNTYRLSSDGKTMDIASTGTKPNGEAFNDTADYTRISGTKGFYGGWKSTKVNMSAPTGYSIKDNGNGTLTWDLPDMKATVTLTTDGKDAAPTGPTLPDGFTISLTKTGPRSFAVVEKVNGKPIFRSRQTVSADGKTLTEVGSPVGVNEPITTVYNKAD